MPGNDTVQSVERAIDLLQALASSDNGLRLSDLAEQLALNTTTAHNLIRTLAGRGFVVKGAGQRLRLGPALAEMLAQEQERSLLRAAAKAGLDLQHTFPDSIVNVAELVGSEVRIRIRLSPDRPGLVQRPGTQAGNPYGTAVGLCCQAFADLAALQALRDAQPFHEYATNLWASPEALADFLTEARRLGHIETPFAKQERPRIAVPVFRPDGQFLAAIGMALPNLDDASRQAALAALRTAAAAIATPEPACTP